MKSAVQDYGGGCASGRLRYRVSAPSEYHIWVSDKLSWVVIGDSLAQYQRWKSDGKT